MKTGLILLGHGARNPAWATPFEAVRQQLLRLDPQALVQLAFLELMSPSLPEAARTLATAGAQSITVLPLFLGGAGHVRRDVEPLMEGLASELGVSVRLLPALGEQPAFQSALAQWCVEWMQAEART